MLYHLEDIEKIREVEKEVSNNGYKVFDISHWDSGKDYNKLLLSSLEIQPYYEPFKYIYNYEISPQIHSLVENKLLQEANTEICSILIPSSTLSIVNIANFLQKHKLNKICLLQPSYFTVEPCLNAFGLHVETRSLESVSYTHLDVYKRQPLYAQQYIRLKYSVYILRAPEISYQD